MKKPEKNRVLSGVMAFTMAGSTFAGIPKVMAANASISLEPTADTFVNNQDDTTKGGLDYAALKSDYGKIPGGINNLVSNTINVRLAYITFDISAVDADTLDDATLKLKLTTDMEAGKTAEVSVFEADSDISEENTKWGNRPKIVDKVKEQDEEDNITDNDAVGKGEASGSFITVKGLGKAIKAAKKSGKTSVTFAVYVNSNDEISFTTREGENKPVLDLTEIDEAAIAQAKAAILAVPEVDLENYNSPELRNARKEALKKYNALTPSEKEVLNQDDAVYTKLMTFYNDADWSTIIGDYDNAAAIVAMINQLNVKAMTADNYTEFYESLIKTGTAYKEASFRAKAAIGSKTYQILVNKEKQYEAFLTQDIDNVKDKITAVKDTTEDNYLNMGAGIIAAREAYDKFDTLMKQTYVGAYAAAYDEVMARLADEYEILVRIEEAVVGYKQNTAEAFVNAWADVKADNPNILASNPANIAATEAALKAFGDEYYTLMTNNLSASAYYKEFADGTLGSEVQNAIEEYLCASYQLAVDRIHDRYGDPNNKEEFERILSGSTGSDNMYVYMYNYREGAEIAYEKLSDSSKNAYESESDYCEAVFRAMMNFIDKQIRDVINADLNIDNVELTKDYIDRIYKVRQSRDSVSEAVKEYLQQYSKAQFDELMERSAYIDQKLDELKALADDEAAKYDTIRSEVEAYGLNYMTGYKVENGVGSVDEGNPYSNVKDFIDQKNNDFAKVNPIIVIGKNDDGSDISKAILEYYYDTLYTASEKHLYYGEVTEKCNLAKDAIASMTDHKNVIDGLRESAKICHDKLSELGKMIKEDDLAAIKSKDTWVEQEDVLKERLEANGKTYEEFKDKYHEAFEAIDEIDNDLSYRKLVDQYKSRYASEDFKNIKEPYLSDEELNKWGEFNEDIIKIIDPDEIYKKIADEWIAKLQDLGQRVKELDNNYEYAHDFAEVHAYQEELKALKAEYDNFEAIVKYYIAPSYLNSEGEGVSYNKLDIILNTEWPEAINVMDMIDEAEAAILTPEWETKLLNAERELNILENDKPNSYSHVASDAMDKLQKNRETFNSYIEIKLWIDDVNGLAADKIDEYALLYTVTADGKTESELSKKIAELTEAGIEDKYDATLPIIQDALDTYGYQQALMKITRLQNEKECALEAEKIDKSIVALKTLSAETFKEELEKVRRVIDELVKAAGADDADKRTQNAALVFNMLTQYATYEEIINNYDETIANNFIVAVEDVGEITYTSDLDAVRAKLDIAERLKRDLNAPQKKLANDYIVKLAILNKKYDKISAAKSAAEDIITELADMTSIIENTVLNPDSYDYKNGELFNKYRSVIEQIDVVDNIVDSVKGTDAYQYLVMNGYIENYQNTVAGFEDDHSYIPVMESIDLICNDAKDMLSFDEDGNPVISDEDRNIIIAETKAALDNYLALAPGNRENVLNYADLQWLVKNIDAARVNEIIEQIKALPDADTITYAKYEGAVKSVKDAYNSLLSENQTRVQLAEGGLVYEKLMNVLIAMGMYEEEYGNLGGKLGDVNGDDSVDINDIILMVDYIFASDDNKPEWSDKQFLRGNLVKASDTSEETIDYHDVAAVIDLIEF